MSRFVPCVVLLLVTAAIAAEPEVPESVEQPREWWTIRFEPAAYFAAPSGDIRLPSSTGTRGDKISVNDLNQDSPRLSPFARLTASRGDWRFTIAGFAFSASDRGAFTDAPGLVGGAPFAAGDRLITDLAYQSVDVRAGYRVIQPRSEAGDSGMPKLEAGLDLLAGIRFHHVDVETSVVSAVPPAPGVLTSADADELFAEPFIGARLDLDLSRTFGIDVESTVGGFSMGDRSSATFTIAAGFVYRPVTWIGVRIGYHMVVFGFSEGSGAEKFEWDGSLAGLFWGAQFSF